MSRLTAAGTELQPLNGKMHFYISAGLDDEAEVRGTDIVVPGSPGRVVPSGTYRVKDRRVVELRGFVHGIGSSQAAAAQDYRSTIDNLHSVFDPTAAPWDLVVYGPVMGVGSGRKRTIKVKYLDTAPGDLIGGISRQFSIRLECVGGGASGNPEWVDAAV